MKKTLLALAITASAATLSAAQLVEAIVIRVGDRVITRTQYARRLHDAYTEIDQTSTSPAEAATKKDELRKNLSNDLIAELLIKDRADRLGLSVSAEELKEAMSRRLPAATRLCGERPSLESDPLHESDFYLVSSLLRRQAVAAAQSS